MQLNTTLLPGARITIHDLTSGNIPRLELMLSLYRELFPDYLYYLPYLQELAYRSADADPRFVEHQWLVEVAGEAAGLVNFTYVPGRDCGLLMELGVHPTFRTLRVDPYARLSQFMVAVAASQVRADAARLDRPVPFGLVVEIPSARSIGDERLQQRRRRLQARYHEYGFIDLPVDYFEPPTIESYPLVSPEPIRADFQRMELALLPIREEPFEPSDPQMLQQIIFALLVDHYGLDEAHWAVHRALHAHSTEGEI